MQPKPFSDLQQPTDSNTMAEASYCNNTHNHKCVIVVPIHKEQPTNDELMSLRQCVSVLGEHQICVVCPVSLDINFYGNILSEFGIAWSADRFPNRFFDGIKGYNLLMLDKSFYKRFDEYEYMLIYQLDAWVFRDELDEWCSKGYDYIGAPWIEYVNGENKLTGVGNGGFSLRRIQHFIDVLSYRGPVRKAYQLNLKPSIKNIIYKFFYSLGYQNTISYYKKDESLYEDIFLSIFLSNTKLKAKMPSPEEASRFAFEKYPSMLFENNGQLPFGCHAWRKYEYESFWKKYIALV